MVVWERVRGLVWEVVWNRGGAMVSVVESGRRVGENLPEMVQRILGEIKTEFACECGCRLFWRLLWPLSWSGTRECQEGVVDCCCGSVCGFDLMA